MREIRTKRVIPAETDLGGDPGQGPARFADTAAICAQVSFSATVTGTKDGRRPSSFSRLDIRASSSGMIPDNRARTAAGSLAFSRTMMIR